MPEMMASSEWLLGKPKEATSRAGTEAAKATKGPALQFLAMLPPLLTDGTDKNAARKPSLTNTEDAESNQPLVAINRPEVR